MQTFRFPLRSTLLALTCIAGGGLYLTGSSVGGRFVLYTMLVKPNLFQGYVADSPSVRMLSSVADAGATEATAKLNPRVSAQGIGEVIAPKPNIPGLQRPFSNITDL